MRDTYGLWVETCRQCGIPVISMETAARLMAVLLEYGNNEGFTHNGKFRADMTYIRDRYGLREGQLPDAEFARRLREYVRELRDYQERHRDDPYDREHPYRQLAPDWAPELLKERYNIKFIG